MSDPQIGEIIGGYRLETKIAAGGMGVVYAARHASLARKAAVKVLATELARDKEFVSRFLHEARIANDLRHPCIVDIFDFVDIETPRRVACIMELLEGPTLADVLRRGPLRVEQAFNVTLQLIDALKSVHALGVIHRDLKPQNIVVVGALDSALMAVPSVKILDFGIAKLSADAVDHKTRTGSIMGTPAYMAPEQVAASEVSTSTDLYALAEILFEMLSGRRVFNGDNLQILRQKMERAPPRFELPETVHGHDRILALTSACLNPEPHQRPSLDDFESAISDLLEETLIGSDAATVMDMPHEDTTTTAKGANLPTIPNVDTDGGNMNTQMFFDRIVEDIDDGPKPVAVVAPPPMEPKQEEHLTLMRAPWQDRAPVDSAPPPPPRAPRMPSRASSIPRVVVGRPVEPIKPRKKRGVLLFVALISLVALAGAGIWFGPRLDTLRAPNTPSPLKADADRWAAEFGGFTGRTSELIAIARTELAKDEDAAYAVAIEATQKLLVADAGHPIGIALYIEALALSSPERITASEQKKLMHAIDWAVQSTGPEPDLTRALATLLTQTGAYTQASETLANHKAPRDQLRLAEAVVGLDPGRALRIVEASDAIMALPRATLIRAAAMYRLGRYKSALLALETRAANPTKAITLLNGMIEAAIGRERQAQRAFESAATTSRLAQLRLAQWRVTRGEEATDTLMTLADDERLREELRAEALRAIAESMIARGATDGIDAILDRLAELRPRDPLVLRTRAERALDSGLLAKATKLIEPAVSADPKAVAPRLIVATIALSQSDHNGAQRAIEAAIDTAPWDPRLRVLLAVVHASARHFPSVDAVIDGLGDLDPATVDEDQRAAKIPNACWAEAEKQLLLAKGEPGAADSVGLLQALLKYYVDKSKADAALAEANKTKPTLVALAHRAQIAIDRRAIRTAQGYVSEMKKIGPKAIAPNLYAARIAAARGQHTAAIGIYERIMAATDAPLPQIERALSLASTNKDRAAGALASLAPVAPYFSKLRRAMFDAGL